MKKAEMHGALAGLAGAMVDKASGGDAVQKAAAPKAKAKGKVNEITVRRGHAGGYIAKNRLEHDDGYQTGHHEYPLASMSDVHKHFDRHMPEKKSAKKAAENSAAAEGC